jgi:hypothetical protein
VAVGARALVMAAAAVARQAVIEGEMVASPIQCKHHLAILVATAYKGSAVMRRQTATEDAAHVNHQESL